MKDLIQSGALVAPLNSAVVGSRAYFVIESPAAAGKPHVRQFADWLVDEARHESAGEGER